MLVALMCGIAGIATVDGLRSSDGRLVDRMLGALAHRGPDDQHRIADDLVAMGARRLAIIDLETGRQPVSNEDASVWATQNGEIYDYVELREQLVARGHRFTSSGDTETIVHGYEDEGPAVSRHLHGMFAIAIWDRPRRRLVLSRDRIGKKPLYWRLVDGRLSWASELKGLLTAADLVPRVDRIALAQYLQLGYVPAPRTILEGVQKLEPASTLTWGGGLPVVERYWQLASTEKRHRPVETDLEEATAIVRDAVRLRLRSDVPVGAFLSGGIDSTIVVALMAELADGPVRTYSIGFEDESLDELPFARRVADRFATDHHEDVVRLDAIGLLPRLAVAFDEPFADPAAVPTFRLAASAAQDLKVVLTGDGGDELFGGYRRYRKMAVLQHLSRALGPTRAPVGRTVARAVSRSSHGGRVARRAGSWGLLSALPPDSRYATIVAAMDRRARAALLGDVALSDQSSYLRAAFTGGTDDADGAMLTDLRTMLPEKLLVKADRATMANSLEARSPLLDHRLAEFALRLPTERKLNLRRSKILLRSIAASLGPVELAERPKQGFDVPIDAWFRSGLGDRYRELVLGADSVTRDHLDLGQASRLLSEHRSGVGERGQELWLILMFELWGRQWLRAAGSRRAA